MDTISKTEKGFTLIEVLLVLGLLVALAGTGLFYSVDSFRRSQFRAERDMVVSLMQQARARGIANINEQSHGVHIDPTSYVLFSGSVYNAADPSNQSYPANVVITHTGMTDVVFSQVSGEATVTGGPLTLSQGSSLSVISINNVGQINWTN